MTRKSTGESPRKKASKAKKATSRKKAAAGTTATAKPTERKTKVASSRKVAAKKVATSRKASASRPARKPSTASNASPAPELKTRKAQETRVRVTADSAKKTTDLSMEAVRQRAFEISQRRPGPSDPVADWFLAEQELATK